MVFWVIILIITVAFIIFYTYASSQAAKFRSEVIERRKKYVQSVSPSARIIVNNGIHLFFKDDDQQVFGIDETGKTYSFSGLYNVSYYDDGIRFMHNDSVSMCVGKDYGHQETTVALDQTSVNAIAAEMMPVLRKNLYVELEKEGVTPTHEYEHEGEIWGCDLNTRKFFVAYGSFHVFDFSDLRRVTIEDLRNNRLYDGSYIIHVFVKSDFGWDDEEFEIHFKSQNSTFNNLLAMFKGIQNRK